MRSKNFLFVWIFHSSPCSIKSAGLSLLLPKRQWKKQVKGIMSHPSTSSWLLWFRGKIERRLEWKSGEVSEICVGWRIITCSDKGAHWWSLLLRLYHSLLAVERPPESSWEKLCSTTVGVSLFYSNYVSESSRWALLSALWLHQRSFFYLQHRSVFAFALVRVSAQARPIKWTKLLGMKSSSFSNNWWRTTFCQDHFTPMILNYMAAPIRWFGNCYHYTAYR